MLQDLPAAVLSLVVRAAVVDAQLYASGWAGRGAPALNLACRATHAALPDAFSTDGDDAGGEDHPGTPSGTLQTEVRKWWPLTAPAAPPTPAVLQLSLDKLSATPSSQRTAALCYTGQRFAKARSLRLLARTSHGMYASAAFAAHAAPLMRGVRRLFIRGPADDRLPSFWEEPAFAPLAAGLRELSIEAFHGSVGPLAARLPAAFPALTALHLGVHSDVATGYCRRGMPEPCMLAITVTAPPRLSSLLMSVQRSDRWVLAKTGHVEHEESEDYVDEGLGLEYSVDNRVEDLTLMVAGHADSLLRLHVFVEKQHRPWTLQSCLPALLTLDTTSDPYSRCDTYGAWDDTFLLGDAPAAELCPALDTLILRSGLCPGRGQGWELERLGEELEDAPLRRIEVFCTVEDPCDEDLAAAREAMLPPSDWLQPGVTLHLSF